MSHFRGRAFAEIRSVDEDGDDLIITGLASAVGLDHKGTHIDQDSVWEAAQRKKELPLFYNHDWGALIGRSREIARHRDGLLVSAAIGKDFDIPMSNGLNGFTWSVNNIRKQIQQGFLKGYSIGFDGEKKARDDGNFDMIVTDLAELSVTPMPANDKTLFGFSRSMILEDLVPSASRVNDRIVNKENRFELIDPEEDDDEVREILFAIRRLGQAVINA